jgi:hypothetical protein
MNKLLAAGFLAATLAAGALSVHALRTRPQTAAACGNSCVAPRLSCAGGCVCDLSLGNGIDTGVCVTKK